VSKDGLHVKFIVADGWMSGSGGRGITIADLGRLAARLNCYSTIVLDGGGSATMVAKRANALGVLNQMPKVIAQRRFRTGCSSSSTDSRQGLVATNRYRLRLQK
jgi:hypothetical protein